MKKINFWLIAIFFWGLTACNLDPAPTPVAPAPAPAPSTGTADFTKYVAVGNSLTAGFSDNGLFRAGQLVSYPNLLSQQFALAGGGAFIQPLFTEAERNGTGFLRLVGVPSAAGPVLETVNTNLAVIRMVNTSAAGSLPILTPFTGANQNLGIPGLRVSEVTTPGLGLENTTAFNPFYERLLGNDGAAPFTTYTQYVTTQATGATFFTLWLGNNDVLLYAASGGQVPMTDEATFNANLSTLLNAVPSTAKGVIANIPNVLKAAFFNTVTKARILQAAGAPPTTNLFIQPASGAARAMGDNDYFLLSQQAEYARIGNPDYPTEGIGFPYGLHPNNPIRAQFVLDAGEVDAVSARITAFNVTIASEATTRDLGLVDSFAILTDWAENGTGASYPFTYNLAFITGGISSLDGVHLTPAGNALIANEFLKVINSKFGSTFSLINPLNYSTLANSRY